MSTRLITLALAGTLVALPVQAQQPLCTDRAELLSILDNKFGENPAILATTDDGRLITVTRRETGAWTMLITDQRGITCIMATGQSWQGIAPLPGQAS